MQKLKIFKYLDWLCRGVLVLCFIIAILQNYFAQEGAIKIFSFTLTQFYPHIELRILPLLWVSFYLIPHTQKILGLKQEFYLSKFLISALVAIDAFTHTNGFYSSSYDFPFYHRVWFDKIMHFAEGMILVMALQPVLLRFTKNISAFRRPAGWANWMVVGFISIFFVLWEILELVIDTNYGSHLITGVTDTNEDLAFAYLGFLVGFGLLRIGRKFIKNQN